MSDFVHLKQPLFSTIAGVTSGASCRKVLDIFFVVSMPESGLTHGVFGELIFCFSAFNYGGRSTVVSYYPKRASSVLKGIFHNPLSPCSNSRSSQRMARTFVGRCLGVLFDGNSVDLSCSSVVLQSRAASTQSQSAHIDSRPCAVPCCLHSSSSFRHQHTSAQAHTMDRQTD